MTKPIIFRGVFYPSQQAAADAWGLTRQAVSSSRIYRPRAHKGAVLRYKVERFLEEASLNDTDKGNLADILKEYYTSR